MPTTELEQLRKQINEQTDILRRQVSETVAIAQQVAHIDRMIINVLTAQAGATRAVLNGLEGKE